MDWREKLSHRLTHLLYQHELRLIAGMWMCALAAATLVLLHPTWWTGALLGYALVTAAYCTYRTLSD